MKKKNKLVAKLKTKAKQNNLLQISSFGQTGLKVILTKKQITIKLSLDKKLFVHLYQAIFGTVKD